ncbi:hypothetical protein [Brevundimonas diminuta]|jgi:hypothetical protein|uniref:hypothetical protein n=1 Tax=Brevundimonas diminuta TaxID=293 RepID=UPI0008CA3344|nr:MAG: hypothetical protein A2352_09165 [Caulobacterales bacterium RIFOXYB1_FULL_67_16]
MSRFLITFDEPDDPLPEIVELIQHRLEPSPVEEVTPGVLAVESDEQTVRAAVEDLPDWKVAREGALKDMPPARGWLRRGNEE